MRERIFRLSCLSPMLGFPQVSLPLATVDGCPMGLSLLGPHGGDAMLLAAAARAA
jgi:amidase